MQCMNCKCCIVKHSDMVRTPTHTSPPHTSPLPPHHPSDESEVDEDQPPARKRRVDRSTDDQAGEEDQVSNTHLSPEHSRQTKKNNIFPEKNFLPCSSSLDQYPQIILSKLLPSLHSNHVLSSSHTHPHTLTHTPSHPHTLTHTPSHPHTHTPSHTHTLTPSHTHPHTHTLIHTPHTHLHTHTRTHPHTLTLTHSPSHTPSHTPSYTHPLTHTFTHTLTHTFIHTHTLIHTPSHTPSHTHPHTHSPSHTPHTHTLIHTPSHTPSHTPHVGSGDDRELGGPEGPSPEGVGVHGWSSC